MLHSPELHESLSDAPWDEAGARRRIREIVADAEDGLRGPRLLWTADPWDGWHATSPMKNLYVGAAGVLWGLDRLRGRGYADTRLDLRGLATATYERFRSRPDYMRGVELPALRESSLACGMTGIALVAGLEDELYALTSANVDSDVDEVMWGAPGTLLVASAMLERTGAPRWREVRDATADALWARRKPDGLWEQRLYGEEYRGLQPWHGLVGNVRALLPALDDERGRGLEDTTARILERTAVVEDGLANWPYTERPRLASPEDGQIRLQFCCGAPGIVATAYHYLPEELLIAGGELAWRAGPPGMEKGPCICHGTAGTGHAFLKLFARTQDERWLERARRFAVHALEQVERRGHGRYSLWTGDVGVALFAADCVDARGELPVFDVL
jgi:lanthionine synthetase-like protein